MTSAFSTLSQSMDRYQEQSQEWLDKLFAAAKPRAVYGEPVTAGNHTIITASEVTTGGGFGYGLGGGSSPGPASEQTPGQDQENAGGGIGLGGGGGSSGRPVAAIIIGPDGVHVEPVVDVTKLGLAVFTTVGAMLMMLGQMRRTSKR